MRYCTVVLLMDRSIKSPAETSACQITVTPRCRTDILQFAFPRLARSEIPGSIYGRCFRWSFFLLWNSTERRVRGWIHCKVMDVLGFARVLDDCTENSFQVAQTVTGSRPVRDDSYLEAFSSSICLRSSVSASLRLSRWAWSPSTCSFTVSISSRMPASPLTAPPSPLSRSRNTPRL